MAAKQAAQKKKRLGRGLSSLISTPTTTEETTPAKHKSISVPSAQTHDQAASPVLETGKPADIRTRDISANPYQPRHEFKPDELNGLAASIREQGILQPLILVRTSDEAADQPYVLIAGERRLRAARQIGLTTVPCVIKDADQQQMLEWAIIENIQREDLNPVDRARAYRDYLDRFQFTQAQAAERLGEPRTTIANHLRILDLTDDVQKMLIDGRLSFGHAKVLAGLAGNPEVQLSLACKVAAGSASVRQLEELVAQEQGKGDPQAAAKTSKLKTRPAYILDLEEQLTQVVGTRVAIQTGKKRHTGKIVLEFYSLDDFDRISQSLGLSIES